MSFVVRALTVALLCCALSGCGYEIRWAVPEHWWNDGATTGPGRIVTKPLIERNAGRQP